MSIAHIYSQCCRYKGRAVHIRTRDGRFHHGIITHVTPNKVYLRPLYGTRNLGGFSFGWGWGWGGFGIGIALGFITSIALASLFFW